MTLSRVFSLTESTYKNLHYLTPFIANVQNGKCIVEDRLVVAKGWRMRGQRQLLGRCMVSFQVIELFHNQVDMFVASAVFVLNTTKLHTSKWLILHYVNLTVNKKKKRSSVPNAHSGLRIESSHQGPLSDKGRTWQVDLCQELLGFGTSVHSVHMRPQCSVPGPSLAFSPLRLVTK